MKIGEKKDFYFVHSYYFDASYDKNIIDTTTYGVDFSSAVNEGNIYQSDVLIEDKIILKKKLDLNKFKSQIKGFLEIEIASRFFFQVGKIESSLGNDLFVDEAVEILTNKDRYTSILSGN